MKRIMELEAAANKSSSTFEEILDKVFMKQKKKKSKCPPREEEIPENVQKKPTVFPVSAVDASSPDPAEEPMEMGLKDPLPQRRGQCIFTQK